MSGETNAADLAVRWLEPSQVKARWEGDSVRLCVSIEARPEVKDAHVTLAFPVTIPGGYVELSNDKGESIGIVRSLDGLDAQSLAALRSALHMRYMIPHVERIVELTEVSPFVLRWRTETDRGDRTFFTESPREAVRYLGADRIRVSDLAGNHYDIRSLAGLDPQSRDLLAAFL